MRPIALLLLLAPLAWPETPNAANPQAVAEVLAGKRTTANAAWWGFDEEDSTDALQAALRSGARRVIVPNMTRDWIVRPIALAGNQELILEPGAVISAKRGEYREKGVSVLAARNVENLTIRGYGATVRMHKLDYIAGHVLDILKWDRYFGMYPKAEWRMTLTIANSTNVKVYGLTLRDSGGDGVYIDGGRDVLLKDIVCDNHYRQGMSIISADGLTVENSVFRNTWGTPPCAGVDIEPDSPKHHIRNVVFRNCAFTGNLGDGIEIFLAHLTAESGPVSILFDQCRVSSDNGTGIRVTKVGDTAPGGLIEFRDTIIENTEGYGLKVQDKSPTAARLRFVNCSLRNTARNRMYKA
ncbi:MAG: right-handed parallel beta-helix repeat-containing protein, partial [Acidobacteria bacterium]|nr:right-handed parallel beta-helix repeat-containing protein [Acidobacteriota bacterium]